MREIGTEITDQAFRLDEDAAEYPQRAPARILLAGGEHVGMLAAVRALRAQGYEPWLAVPRPGTYAARSRAVAQSVEVPDPGTDPPGFAAAVARVAARHRVAAVLPGTESALLALAQGADRFPSSVALGVCPPGTVDLVTDKVMLERLAWTAGLAVPPTTVVDIEDLDQSAGAARYPAVLKPFRSELRDASGKLRRYRVQRVEGPDELRAALRSLPDGHGLLQPYLDGQVGAAAGVMWDGSLVCAVHMVAERIWPPSCGTFAYARAVGADLELEAGVERLLTRMGWRGIFQVDWIEWQGRRYLIDLNPRLFTSLGLAVASGLNLPAIWVDLLLGRPPRVGDYRPGVRYRYEKDDLRAVLGAAANGQGWRALRGLVPHRQTTHAVFSRHDPGPVLTTLTKLRQGKGR